MKQLLSILLVTILLGGCKSQKSSASQIGIKQLTNYKVNQKTILADSVNFFFFTNESLFHNNFYMTKATAETAIVPSFNGQSVAAIVLHSTTNNIDVKFSKAEVAGKAINIYYDVINLEGTSFSHTPSVVAVVPKVIDIKEVHFYTNNTKQKTLPVSFQ